MKKFEKTLDAVMRFLMAVAMGSLILFGSWQVISSAVFNKPSTFTDEFLRYTLIVASLIGSAYCFYKDEHLSLELVTDRAKGPFKIILSIFIEAAILFFVIYVFIIGGFKLASTAINISPVMHIPMKALYMVEPISGILIVLGRVLKYVELFADRKAQKGENA